MRALDQDNSLIGFVPQLVKLAPRHAQAAVGGRLVHFHQVWKALTEDHWVLRTIQRGLQLVWITPPPRYRSFPTNVGHMSKEQVSLVEEEIASMRAKEAIYQISPGTPGFESPLFITAKKGGGYRPVFNLKDLNSHLESPHFKMEGLHMLPDLLRKGEFMAKLDLKDAYFSIPVQTIHQPFLQFTWKGRSYRFRVLPFGLAPGPVIFTKVLKPVLAFLREKGVRLIQYLDDCLIIGSSREECKAQVDLVTTLLQSLGFLINFKKSVLIPCQEIEFLGVIINSVTMFFSLPKEKIDRIKKACQHQLLQKSISALQLSQLLGQLSSTRQAVLAAPLYLRELQRCLARVVHHPADYSNDNVVHWTQLARKELTWWATHLPEQAFRPIRIPPPSVVITTDASLVGWGAVCQDQEAHGQWTQVEASTYHINELELLTGFFALRCFMPSKRDIHIQLRMDNRCAISYVNNMGGTHSGKLHKLAVQMWEWCQLRNLHLSAVHIPGAENIEADSLSRLPTSDTGDWMLHPDVFSKIRFHFLVDVDLFANRTNAQLPRYFSLHLDPFAEGIDALGIPWTAVKGYAFPPFILIGRCLQKIQLEEVDHLILVAPHWPAQPWYPMLLQSLIAPPRLLSQREDLLRDAVGRLHPLVIQDRLPLAVWPVSGKEWKVKTFRQGLQASSYHHGEQGQNVHILPHGASGVAGVLNGKSIPFLPL